MRKKSLMNESVFLQKNKKLKEESEKSITTVI